MATDTSCSGNLASWFSAAGLSSLSPPPHLPSAAAAAAVTVTERRPSTDQYCSVMLTQRRTVSDSGRGGGDQMLAGLDRRPTVLHTEDRRGTVTSSAIRPTAVDAVASASKYIQSAM